MYDPPDPLTPANCDLRNFPGFMLNIERLLASELWALATGSQFKAALALWCRAWKQIPAASLPNDDAVLAAFSGLPTATFNRDRPIVMKGFVLCSDGRFYHRTLAEDANRAWAMKRKRERDRAGDSERLKRWREGRRNASPGEGETISETPHEAADETRFIGVHAPSLNGERTPTKCDGQGQGQGQDTDIKILTGAPNCRTSGNGQADDDDFARFWTSYPRKQDKGHARKAWKQARQKAPAGAIINGLTRCQFSDDPKFRPLAATWLTGERWTDDPQPISHAATTPGTTPGSTFTRMSGGF